jgi:hypothetical protein
MRAAQEVQRQLAARNFNADSLQGAFPAMRLTLDAGRTGFLHGVARTGGMDFRTARADISTGPEAPFHIDVSILSVRAADIITDTVALHAIRNGDRLDYALRLANRPGDPAEPRLIRVAGSVGGNTLTANVLQRNSAGETGFDATLTATLRDSTVRVELADGPTLGYRRWKVGDDGDMHHPAGAFDHPTTGPGNWLEFDLDGRLRADLHLTSDKPTATGRGSRGGGTSVGMGASGLQWGGASAIASVIAGVRSHVSLTSSSLPGISHGAVRLSVAGLDIGPMLDLFPSAPRVDGVLSTDLTVGFLPPGEENGGVVAARGTLGARDFAYEGRRVADVEAEVDFGADAAGTMRLDAAMKLEKETALTARGTYAAGAMEVTVDIPAVPLAVAQRLLPPGTATLSGSLGGRLRLAGDAARPEISGDVGFVDGRARIDMLGTTFGISAERVKIEAGRVTFRDWGLTAPNNRQLRVNGTVNVADPAAPAADVSIRASNFQFVNSNHIGGSQIYGRAALSADVTAAGPLGAVKVRGDVRLTDDTDIVYIMRQGSTLRDERQHVVRFERFADTLDLDWTPPPVAAPRVGMDMLLRVVAREGMKATVSMDEVNENRVELVGGGDLSMSVNREGDVRLAGRYILSGGTLHYRPPLIPRKVFAVAEGSYVEWRGRPLEPELHITASQSTSVRLDHDGGTSEDVRFDITAAVTGSLSGMDILFDLAAPDNMPIQDQLLAMSPEGRMQAALSMMIYNRYSGPGVSSRGMALDARGQINDFISREINQWARNNMRGVDFSVGIATREGAAEGDNETNYSYSVSKRLLSDRMKITIGGKVSDRGANDAGSLLEDVELEYRLNRRENIFFKLYRYNTRASMLEGEVTETGAGFVMRRKVTKIKNLFRRPANPFTGGRRRRTGNGEERRDSLPPRKATTTETKSDETER